MTHTEFFEQPHIAAALHSGLPQPALGDLAEYLRVLNEWRPMSAEQLRQEAERRVKR